MRMVELALVDWLEWSGVDSAEVCSPGRVRFRTLNPLRMRRAGLGLCLSGGFAVERVGEEWVVTASLQYPVGWVLVVGISLLQLIPGTDLWVRGALVLMSGVVVVHARWAWTTHGSQAAWTSLV